MYGVYRLLWRPLNSKTSILHSFAAVEVQFSFLYSATENTNGLKLFYLGCTEMSLSLKIVFCFASSATTKAILILIYFSDFSIFCNGNYKIPERVHSVVDTHFLSIRISLSLSCFLY